MMFSLQEDHPSQGPSCKLEVSRLLGWVADGHVTHISEGGEQIQPHLKPPRPPTSRVVFPVDQRDLEVWLRSI